MMSRLAAIASRPLPLPSRTLGVFILSAVFLAVYAPIAMDLGFLLRSAVKTDLASFYAAAHAAFSMRESPYHLETLRPLVPGAVFPFLYPPQSLLLFFPLSKLDYDQADVLMLAVNHACLCALAWLIPFKLLRLSPQRNLVSAALLIAGILTFWPVEWCIREGQVNLIVATCIVSFWILARDGHDRSAGLFLAIAVCMKAYPALFVALLLLVGMRRTAFWTVAWIAVLTAIGLAVLPAAAWIDWFSYVLPAGGYGHAPDGLVGPAALGNPTLNGTFSRAFTDQLDKMPVGALPDPLFVAPLLGKVLTYASALALMAITVRVVLRRAPALDRTRLLETIMIGGLPLMLLVSPIAWTHHQTYLLPALAVLAIRYRPLGRAVIWHWIAIGGIYLFMDERDLFPLQMFPVLAMWVYGIWSIEPALLRERRKTASIPVDSVPA